jgi:hypothetical protein
VATRLQVTQESIGTSVCDAVYGNLLDCVDTSSRVCRTVLDASVGIGPVEWGGGQGVFLCFTR